MGRGINKHPLYPAYSGMVNRCNNPNNESYHLYGCRGIAVCDRWRFGDGDRSGFHCWLEDMGGYRPAGMTLDRKDTDGPYSPDNCRWATHKEQRANQSSAGKRRQREAASASAKMQWQDRTRATHCRKGHEFTAENAYVRADGSRQCRACGRLYKEAERRATNVPVRNLKKRHHHTEFQSGAVAVMNRRA